LDASSQTILGKSWDPNMILWLFVSLRLGQMAVERFLSTLNRSYYSSAERQRLASQMLGISDAAMQKSLAYSNDKFIFARVAGTLSLACTLAFLIVGGLGVLENLAQKGSQLTFPSELVTGLYFFGLLGLLSSVFSLPFDYYRTFVLEQKHGFNRQTPRGFWVDRLKGLILAVALGAPILSLLLWLIQAAGTWWWLYAWVALSAFSVLTAWLYPTFLAPLFNKFTPVTDEGLKQGIETLAAKVGFRTAGISIMDASQRSSHGNAYFTGVFGKKRIVLFDTLVQAMAPHQVVAVLAHELGHFKLHHVRWSLIRGVLATGLIFYLLSLCLPMTIFYQSFGLSGVSAHGALVVFSLWFGLLDFALQPIGNAISRRNEFAADRFATEHTGSAHELGSALLKLRETSAGMPLSHPLFSAFYHSHPPLLERLTALGYTRDEAQPMVVHPS